ncbi:hypothetical protein M422DRAFT_188032, partial [Sphaerobolus stellatus SS14]
MIPVQRLQLSLSGRLHQIRPILKSPLSLYYAASDYRAMAILSYFYSRNLASDETPMSWSIELPLCARMPWEVESRTAIKQIVLTGAGYEDVTIEHLGSAINCGIVALIAEDEDIMENAAEINPEGWPYIQGSSTPSPTSSNCIGLGFIRGVDPNRHVLQLITPVPPAELSKCTILVKGELDMPVWGFLDFRQDTAAGVAGVKWEKVPYLQMGGGD